MTKTLTFEIDEVLYDLLVQTAEQCGRPWEDVVVQFLAKTAPWSSHRTMRRGQKKSWRPPRCCSTASLHEQIDALKVLAADVVQTGTAAGGDVGDFREQARLLHGHGAFATADE